MITDFDVKDLSLADAGAQPRVRAPRFESAHQVGGLGCHMQAGSDPNALQRLFPVKALADEAQNRHLLFRLHNAAFAGISQAQILHVKLCYHIPTPSLESYFIRSRVA